MKRYIKSILFLSLTALLLCFSACRSKAPSDFSYRQKKFTVRMEGNQYGVDLSCDICCENGTWKTVSYLSPEPLSGLTVTALENGDCRVERDGLSACFSMDDGTFSGLLLPARVLLLDGGEMPDVQSTQRLPEGHRFTVLADGEDAPVTLTLRDGFPIFAAGDGFSFRAEPISPPDSHGH